MIKPTDDFIKKYAEFGSKNAKWNQLKMRKEWPGSLDTAWYFYLQGLEDALKKCPNCDVKSNSKNEVNDDK